MDALATQRITDLKRKAREAERAGADEQALKIYDEILDLDPDDPLAGSRSEDLRDKIQRARTQADDLDIERATREAAEARLAALLDRAAQALVEAKGSHAREPLQRAEALLLDARRLITAPDPRLERLEQQAADERRVQRNRAIELWGGIGVLSLLLIGGLAIYFWRRPHSLEMLEGPEPGRLFPLRKDAIVLGALASEADWAIADPMRKVSRRHCEIVKNGRHHFLVDRSTNGTLLNGRPIPPGEPVLLKRGDHIGLGRQVTLRFQ